MSKYNNDTLLKMYIALLITILALTSVIMGYDKTILTMVIGILSGMLGGHIQTKYIEKKSEER